MKKPLSYYHFVNVMDLFFKIIVYLKFLHCWHNECYSGNNNNCQTKQGWHLERKQIFKNVISTMNHLNHLGLRFRMFSLPWLCQKMSKYIQLHNCCLRHIMMKLQVERILDFQFDFLDFAKHYCFIRTFWSILYWYAQFINCQGR